MLIDIEKYVRQLLPPNRREPVHVALATLLFRPIEAVIRAFNDYAYDSQFDTGTPGQVGVMQTILNIYVDPNAKVIDGDGVEFDFIVLVAQPSLHKKARQLVERYRMTGKRYDVATAVSWGDSTISFSFQPGFPRVDQASEGLWVVSVAVNEPGLHPTVITNQTTGRIFVDSTLQFGSGSLNLNVDEEGEYRIQVRGAVGFATAVAGGLVCDLVWLDQNPQNPGAQSLATRWQGGVRQLYIYLHSGRASIAPFVTRIYDSNAAEVHSFNWNNPQGQWHNLPASLGNGAYTVEVADKDGCVTGTRALTFEAEPVEEVVINSVTVSVVGGIYRVEVDFSGGRELYGISGFRADNSQLFNGSSGAAGPWAINLSSNTPAQTISVRVTDANGLTDLETGVALPVINTTCDLVWLDQQNPGSPSLATRWQGGVRQLFLHLYSGRADIAPFTTRIYQGGSEVHSFNWNNPQAQWHNLPGSLGDGAYEVEVTDKTGCTTSRRGVTFQADTGNTPTVAASYGGNLVVQKAGKRYTYNDTPDIGLEIMDDGKVRLIINQATKTSQNGKTCVPRVLVNERVNRQSFRDALLGPGGAAFKVNKPYSISIAWLPQDIIQSYADINDHEKMHLCSHVAGISYPDDTRPRFLNSAGYSYIYLTIETI